MQKETKNKAPAEQAPASVICKNCGALVKTEICPYCGFATGIDMLKVDSEYPVFECREVHLSFWTLGFPAVFAAAFIIFTGVGLFLMPLLAIVFGLGGIIATYIVVSRLIGYLAVKLFGKTTEGVIYGHVDDNFIYNNKVGKVAKILIDTKKGKRFVMYQLGDTFDAYGLNSTVELRFFGNLFLLENNLKSEDYL